MCSKNRINHHAKDHTWTPGFLGGNPNREKTTAAVAQPSIFYYRENILQHMCWRRLDQHAGTHLRSFTSLSWKGATTPCSRLPASPGRELQPPDWRLQPSAPLWTTFHQFSHWIQQIQHNTTCRPLFIRFLDWTHSTHLSPKNIHQTETHNHINSFTESSINQPTTDLYL